MTTKQKQGFTIIEVVLVLAIAGLIFLIVFLALPALQRSQRDTQRKNDVGRAISAIQSFQGNNRGNLPVLTDVSGAGIVNSAYLTDFADPSGGDYRFVAGTSSGAGVVATQPTNITDGRITYVPSKDCSGTAKGSRTVAIYMALENGGTYCQNN